VTEEATRGLKFSGALPAALVERTLSSRLGDTAIARRVLNQAGPVVVVA
jgi:hypothetical protein